MSRQLNPSQVWSQVPVANRLIEVNTKTGFSLTAGSYSVRASSVQSGMIFLPSATSATGTISSVTTARATGMMAGNASSTATSELDRGFTRVTLTNATTVTVARNGATDNNSVNYVVNELY